MNLVDTDRQRTAGHAPANGTRADLVTVTLALLLLGAAVGVGMYLNRAVPGVKTWVLAPPLYASWLPHFGPGTVPAVLVAVLVVVYGPMLARRLHFPALLGVGYAGAFAWTCCLALIDGVHDGLEDALLARASYLSDVGRVSDIATMLHEFTGRILWHQPDSWAVHVSGHPPGALLMFVWLDRVGLGGALPAAFACIIVGCLVAVAVPATVAVLAGRAQARAVVPFAALFPGAVWVGVSADGLFAGVTACGLALLAWAAVALRDHRRGGVPVAVGAGLILGFGIFLSYGLVLLGLLAVVIVIVAGAGLRSWKVLLCAVAGAVAVVAAFAAAGFWWFDGYQLVVQRYYQGVAHKRPYEYWFFGNLAALVLVLGPALIAAGRRAVARSTLDRPWLRDRVWQPVAALTVAALLIVMIADLSGLSKAEVERIWLPFAVWIIPAAALLPASTRRWWLVAQGVTALAVNHLVLTLW